MHADVVVVGAGIAGLCAAWEASRSGASVHLYEASDVPGGKIQGVDLAGEFTDVAADAFLARVPWAAELCRDLGMESELVSPASGQAWLWVRGRLRRLPAGLVLGVPSRWLPVARSGILSPLGLARLALDEIVSVHMRADDPTVATAIGQHVGSEVMERLVDPLIGGINAGDSWELSLTSAAPQLVSAAAAQRLMPALRRQQQRQSGSDTSAGPSSAAVRAARDTGAAGSDSTGPIFLAPRGGMTAIIDRLVSALPDGVLRLRSPVRAVGPGWLTTDSGTVTAERIVLATPAFVNAALVGDTFPLGASLFGKIPYVSVAMTLLGYERSSVQLPAGSGMLVPRTERRLMSAASWYDQKWPHHKREDLTVIRVSSGRSGDLRHQGFDDDDLGAILHSELSEAVRTVPGCHLPNPPKALVVKRWDKAFPQYISGHMSVVGQLREVFEPSGIRLVGAAYGGVGIAACVRDGRAAGQA